MSSSLPSLLGRYPNTTAAQQHQNQSNNAAAVATTATIPHRILNAIYVAIDHHQYTRAIKLCQQQIHETNTNNIIERPYIVYALLAHAYAKTGQKYKAVCTICNIFSIPTTTTTSTIFPELQLYLKYSSRYEREMVESSSMTSAGELSFLSSSNTNPAIASANKRGGTKKVSTIVGSAAKEPPTTSTDQSTSNWDWIDSLDNIPMLPTTIEDWEQQLPPLSSTDDNGHNASVRSIVNDSSIVTTIALTLNNVLKFHYTAYQLYMWSISCVEKEIQQLSINTTNGTETEQQQQQMTSLLVVYIHKAYMIGVGCLALPQYNRSIQHILLTQLQILAIQLTRLQQQQQQQQPHQQQEQEYCSMLWAAQTALWKYTLQEESRLLQQEPPPPPQQQIMLLRLAESMAMKCIDMYSTTTNNNNNNNNASTINDENEVHNIDLAPIESYHLYLQTLKLQKKWEAILQYINLLLLINSASTSESAESIPIPIAATKTITNYDKRHVPPHQTLLELKVEALQQQMLIYNTTNESNDNSSIDIYANDLLSVLEELLHLYPDDWIYWKQYCNACIESCNGNVFDGCTKTEAFRQQIIELQQTKEVGESKNDHHSPKHRIRGPDLMHVELASRRLMNIIWRRQQRNEDINVDEYIASFIEAIEQYGSEWSHRTSCIYIDLSTYLDQLLNVCTEKHAIMMLNWVRTMRTTIIPSSPVLKERHKELRMYIFAIQVSFHILSHFINLQLDHLIQWEELVGVWQSFQAIETSENVDQAQMESRPADELILLAVQRLLNCTDPQQEPTAMDFVIAATILESAMRYSPYNPHLKICAIHVYGKLDAPSRSWELFKDLNIKHVQYESCSYLILPILRSGGMFHETILVCREILGLHLSSARDVPDYMGRAMECGNVRKAEEFLLFHRDKMTNSLTTLEAKGLILDTAPLLVDENDGSLGMEQGIVGAETDFDRVKQMIVEAHNPSVVFSILQVGGEFNQILKSLSDNRDFSVLSYEILVKRDNDTAAAMLSEALRRGHQHNILIRAALCIEGTKGPKKGKVTKSSVDLQKRCLSLLTFIRATDKLFASIISSACNEPFLKVIRELCIVTVSLSSGLDHESGGFTLDSLESREAAVCVRLNKAIEELQVAKTSIFVSNDLTLSKICLLTADYLVSVFAMSEIVIKLMDLFGWGRRKRKTKRCAAAVANFAEMFSEIVTGMIAHLESCAGTTSSRNPDVSDRLPGVVEVAMFHVTSESIASSQENTRERIKVILKYIRGRLLLLVSDD